MINLFRRIKFISRMAFTDKYLLGTNCLISVSLSSVGDMIEQQLEIYKKEIERWDPVRTKNMAASGMTVGVFCHYWYKVLDSRLPGRQFKTVVKKVLVDQIVASPIVIFMFFTTLGIMKRESMDQTIEEMRHKFIRLYKAEWIVWPTAQVINFWILPNRFRVLYDNTISLGYDVYTSYVINEPIPSPSTTSVTATKLNSSSSSSPSSSCGFTHSTTSLNG